MMLHIGCHLSCSNGYMAMGKQALELGADTFQFFTRNPRGGSVLPRSSRMRRIRSMPARRMNLFAILRFGR